MTSNDDDFSVYDDNGAIVATLWCEIIGAPIVDVYCPGCFEFSGFVADYAMGFGMTCTGITRRFVCPECGSAYDLPCPVVLKDKSDYE